MIINSHEALFGPKVLEEVDSPKNGKIIVVRSLALGTYIQVDNLTQSGGLINDIWKSTLARLKDRKVNSSLILGLGGGSVSATVRKYWPNTKITGVDIDPLMVEMGRKYLGLNGVEVQIGDAAEFSLNAYKGGQRYDLILVDTYIGRNYPKKLENDDYLLRIKGLLIEGGVAVFNRLYMGDERGSAVKFGDKLERIFSSVERHFPEANIMFICSS